MQALPGVGAGGWGRVGGEAGGGGGQPRRGWQRWVERHPLSTLSLTLFHLGPEVSLSRDRPSYFLEGSGPRKILQPLEHRS